MKLEERVEKLEKENKKLKKFLEVIKKTFCLICKFLKGDKESSDLSFDDGVAALRNLFGCFFVA